MCVGTELHVVLQNGKALGWKVKAEEMERPFRLIQMINPATMPKSNINPDMIPTTVSTIEESKSPNKHKNDIEPSTYIISPPFFPPTLVREVYNAT